MVSRDSKVLSSASSYFLLIIIRSGYLAENRLFVCISKSQRSKCFSFSRRDSSLCIHHLFVWSNLNFLHNSQWITLPTQSYIVLYSFYYFIPWEFFTPALADGLSLKFEWQQSPQVSWTFLSILNDLSRVVVWMVSTHPLISEFSNLFNNHSVTVQRTQIKIGINIIFMLLSFSIN